MSGSLRHEIVEISGFTYKLRQCSIEAISLCSQKLLLHVIRHHIFLDSPHFDHVVIYGQPLTNKHVTEMGLNVHINDFAQITVSKGIIFGYSTAKIRIIRIIVNCKIYYSNVKITLNKSVKSYESYNTISLRTPSPRETVICVLFVRVIRYYYCHMSSCSPSLRFNALELRKNQ